MHLWPLDIAECDPQRNVRWIYLMLTDAETVTSSPLLPLTIPKSKSEAWWVWGNESKWIKKITSRDWTCQDSHSPRLEWELQWHITRRLDSHKVVKLRTAPQEQAQNSCGKSDSFLTMKILQEWGNLSLKRKRTLPGHHPRITPHFCIKTLSLEAKEIAQQ